MAQGQNAAAHGPRPDALWAEMTRLIQHQLDRFDQEIGSPSVQSNWLGPQRAALSDPACREALRSMLKARLADLCLGFAAALDGATEMSDGGQPLFLADTAGNVYSGTLVSELTDHFDQHLF